MAAELTDGPHEVDHRHRQANSHLILPQILSGHIHQPESVCIRHLGELNINR